jgi:hypothetical protein
MYMLLHILTIRYPDMSENEKVDITHFARAEYEQQYNYILYQLRQIDLENNTTTRVPARGKNGGYAILFEAIFRGSDFFVLKTSSSPKLDITNFPTRRTLPLASAYFNIGSNIEMAEETTKQAYETALSIRGYNI